jgi:hypothetical protein
LAGDAESVNTGGKHFDHHAHLAAEAQEVEATLVKITKEAASG